MVDVCTCIQNDDGVVTHDTVEKIMYAAFLSKMCDNEYIDGNVQKIYTKQQVSEKRLKALFSKFISEKIKNLSDEAGGDNKSRVNYANTIEAMFETIGRKNAAEFTNANAKNGNDDNDDNDDGNDDDDNDDGENEDNGISMNIVEEVSTTKSYANKTLQQAQQAVDKEITVLHLLQSSAMSREMKITHLNTALSSVFPEVEGDKVTFIGSTFLKMGEERPYLNHCLTVDT
jgi:hypothetical protein